MAPTGIVEEDEQSLHHLKAGDPVLIPFNVLCGSCYFCQEELYRNCGNTNLDAAAKAHIGLISIR